MAVEAEAVRLPLTVAAADAVLTIARKDLEFQVKTAASAAAALDAALLAAAAALDGNGNSDVREHLAAMQAALADERAAARDVAMSDRAALAQARGMLEILTVELRKTQEELRTMRPTARSRRPLVPDADGYDLRPDPLTARTAAELVAALRDYRSWAGDPPFRQIAARSRQRAAASTICTTLLRDELPRLDVVLAVIIGCGGGDDEARRWATAWRRIKSGSFQDAARPAPALRAVPGPAAT